MPGRKKLGLALWLAAGLLIATAGVPAAAEAPPIVQKPIAQIKKVTGQASVLRSGERRPAKVGDMLFVKDVIETGSDGGIGITFIDNTVFSAGPNSQIALDEFQFDSNNFQGAMLAECGREPWRRLRRHRAQHPRSDEDQDADRDSGGARHDLRGSGLWRALMMRRPFLCARLAGALAGCPRQALFVVLPNAEGGGAGAITVEDGQDGDDARPALCGGGVARRQQRAGRGKPREHQRDLPARDCGAADPAAPLPPLFHPRQRRADPRVASSPIARCSTTSSNVRFTRSR